MVRKGGDGKGKVIKYSVCPLRDLEMPREARWVRDGQGTGKRQVRDG